MVDLGVTKRSFGTIIFFLGRFEFLKNKPPIDIFVNQTILPGATGDVSTYGAVRAVYRYAQSV